jgi:serine protease Do
MEKGLIVTNNHVVEGADLLHLKLANMKSYDAKVLARDPRTDLAVIKINDKKFDRTGLKTLNFDKTSNIQPGEFVLALGAPFGLEASVSFGVVSAVNRGNLNITELGDFIQTDAAINPGNSGGPLLNVEGKVVGISTAIYSQSGVYNGVGFAIPSKLVKRVVDKLVASGRVDRGYMGVRLRPGHTRGSVESITMEAEGAVIAMVTEKSPAALAGIKAGDVITAVNEKRVGTPVDLTNTIGMLEPGSEVDVEFKRGNDRQRVSMRLEPYPEVRRFPEALSGR